MLGKVLVVDDEEILRRIYADRLSVEGFTVDLATDGQEALQKIEVSKPDLVLLDLLMPRVDGFQVLEALKNKPELSNIPVVVLTNVGQEENVQRALSLGAKDYLLKTSHTPNEVLQVVRSHIKAVAPGHSANTPPQKRPYQLSLLQNAKDYVRLSGEKPFLKDYKCTACGQPLQLELNPDEAEPTSHNFAASFICSVCGQKA